MSRLFFAAQLAVRAALSIPFAIIISFVLLLEKSTPEQFRDGFVQHWRNLWPRGPR